MTTTTTGDLFVAPDAHGDPSVWLRRPDGGDGIALARRTEIHPALWDLLAGVISEVPDRVYVYDWQHDGRTAYVPVTVVGGPDGDGDLLVSLCGHEVQVPADTVVVREVTS
jgi:hypothetical protein